MTTTASLLTKLEDSEANGNSPYHIDIILNKKIYNPGETIYGEVIFRFDKKLSCDMITVQLFGSVRVFWIDNGIRNGNLRRIPHEQKRVLIDEKATLWCDEQNKIWNKYTQPNRSLSHEKNCSNDSGTNDDNNIVELNDIVHFSSPTSVRLRKIEKNAAFHGIGIGYHKYKFTFELPKNGLYTSFDLKNCDGRVRYAINVECLSYSRLVIKKSLTFPIVCPTNLNNYKEAMTSACIRKRIEFKKGKYFEVELSISRRCLVPGEALPAQVRIDNRSGKSIKFSHLSIQQNVFCVATCPFTHGKEWFQDTLGVDMDINKIPTGCMHKYVPKFNVPALIPGFQIDGFLTLDYKLKLEIGFDKVNLNNDMKHVVCILTIPIFITTGFIGESDLEFDSNLQEASEPPPNYYDVQPPSYDECKTKINFGIQANSEICTMSALTLTNNDEEL
ncbi:unnamed protein product [Thelazia callipaeda]|uniref:Arrestin_C domain-containing protein n=1 Tax=Thelazia callipaeda TaxID=103827 RepID=A0A0N5D8G4_THECL|nr:unnamed protein product [Thelazia callipaeda]